MKRIVADEFDALPENERLARMLNALWGIAGWVDLCDTERWLWMGLANAALAQSERGVRFYRSALQCSKWATFGEVQIDMGDGTTRVVVPGEVLGG